MRRLLILLCVVFCCAQGLDNPSFVASLTQPAVATGYATNENNFQVEVTTTTSPQDFICAFVSPSTLHVEWGDSTTNDFTSSITNTHEYATAGTYTIRFSGHVHGIDFYVLPDPGTGTPLLISAIKTPMLGLDGVVSAVEMFKHCENITSIPSGLFDACPSITKFEDVFLACKKLESIPDNLFGQQTNVVTFYAAFDSCDIITSIPDGLFDRHTNNLNFAWAFAKCYALTNIPDGWFDNNPKVTTFAFGFYQCFALTNIPSMLFNANTNVTTYAYCFYGCAALTGHTPTNSAGAKLWELSPAPTGTACFTGCTNLTDYADIPAGWK